MAKIARKRKEKFETLPTELPGVQLKIESGARLDILRKTITRFYKLAKQFAKVYFQINELTNQQQLPLRKEIIAIAEKHQGLRGLISEADNFVLTLTPREKIIWDRELLKESFGVAYPAVVSREYLVVSILVPVGFITEKGVTISEEVMIKAIEEALANLEISMEDLAKIMCREVNISVDEEKLNEMVNRGQVKLLKGTKTSEITWQTRVDHLKK